MVSDFLDCGCSNSGKENALANEMRKHLTEEATERCSSSLCFACFDEEQDIPNTSEKSRKNQSVTECCECGKCRVMDIYVECLSCSKVEVFGYFQLLDRYHGKNAINSKS